MIFIKSNNLTGKIRHFILASSVLASVYCVALPAQSADIKVWRLNFFDNSGTQVGSGEFKYDLDTTTLILGDSEDESFYVQTELTSFSSGILGAFWSLDNRQGQLWWEPSSRTVKGAIGSRYGIDIQDAWVFGDLDNNENPLRIDGFGFSEGVWSAQLNGGATGGSGKWTAQAIPEPFTILGSLTAIGFGIGFKRCQKK